MASSMSICHQMNPSHVANGISSLLGDELARFVLEMVCNPFVSYRACIERQRLFVFQLLHCSPVLYG